MACVNISGRLYPLEALLNATESDDSSELVQMLGGLAGGLVDAGVSAFNFSSVMPTRPSSKELPGVFCMRNPEQMLEQWEIKKNLAMLVSYSVIFVIGVVGNITAMLGMIGDRKSRNATTLFLVSLSAADLLLLLVCAPLEALQYFVIQWDEAGTICKTAKYAEVLSAVASVLNLTAVSLERFIVIVFPMRSRSVCTISNCRRAVLVVWIISLILTAPVLFTKGTNPLTFTDGEQSITINYCEDKGDGRIFAIYQAVILLLAPGLVMIICYTYVIRELWISTRNMRMLTNTNASHHHDDQHHHEARRWRNASKRWLYHATPSGAGPTALPAGQAAPASASANAPSGPTPAVRGHEACLVPCHGPCAASNQAPSCQSFNGANRQHHHQHHQAMASPLVARRDAHIVLARKPLRVIKMLILVIVLFLICWGSRLSMEIMIKVGLDTFSQEIYFVRIAINLLPFVHSCLNPFIYSLMSKTFRRSMWRRLHCCCAPCCHHRRSCVTKSMERCTCQSVVTDNEHGQAVRCRHCQQFSSHYNLNVMVNVDGAVALDAPNTRPALRSIATTLRIGAGPRTPANSPLLARLGGGNRSMYANGVVTPECGRHTDVDCRV